MCRLFGAACLNDVDETLVDAVIWQLLVADGWIIAFREGLQYTTRRSGPGRRAPTTQDGIQIIGVQSFFEILLLFRQANP